MVAGRGEDTKVDNFLSGERALGTSRILDNCHENQQEWFRSVIA